jgi:hypothetical protein
MSLVERDIGFQAADQGKLVILARFFPLLDSKRNQQARPRNGEPLLEGQYTDDGDLIAVDLDPAADELRVAAVAVLPELVGRYDDRLGVGQRVVGKDHPSELDRDVEEGERVRRRRGATDQLEFVFVR